MVKYGLTYLLACFALLLAACSDDDAKFAAGNVSVTLSDTKVTIPVGGRYYDLTAVASDGSRLAASSDAEWLVVSADTVASDGSFEIYVQRNEDEIGRDATISIYGYEDMTLLGTVAVHQQGPNEVADNADDNIYSASRLGYGYNIFKGYMDDESKTCAVLNTNNAVVQEMMQVSLSNKEEVEHLCSNTLSELASLLTKSEEKSSSGLTGNKKTSSRFEQSSTVDIDEAWFSYIKLYRTVANASLDIGMLTQSLDVNGSDLFTDDFKEVYNELTATGYVPTDSVILSMLKTYGTHIIVQSEMGGSMDLTLNFKRTMTGTLNVRAEDFSGFFFSGDNLEYSVDDVCTNIYSNDAGTSSFKIVGGSKSARNTIKNSVNSNKRVNTDQLLAWQNSLNISSVQDLKGNTSIVPMKFQMIPISMLFPQKLQKAIFDGMLTLSQASTNDALDDIKASTDKYTIALTSDLLSFPTSDDASLVKVLYTSNLSSGALIPTLEICNEYVPKIRGDKRINVVYAIRNGKTFHGAGLFPGDGAGNPPAWLTFSDGDVYVNPIKDSELGNVIDTVYFMHGNIYETDLGLAPPAPRRSSVDYHYCKVETTENGKVQTVKMPCLKIGSGYWTRSNSKVNLHFAVPSDEEWDDWEYEYYEFNPSSGKYYAMLKGYITNEFLTYNGEYLGPDGQWFVPTIDDVNDLRLYMSNNPKAFFKGQVSGFNAEFDGYYGDVDVITNKRQDEEAYRYIGKLCCIACQSADANNKGIHEGRAMLLWDDYTLGLADDFFFRNSYFTVRLYRTSDYKYYSK